MKYQEIEKWFDRFLIDELYFRGGIKLVIPGESEMLNALETYVEQHYSDLMNAEDLSLKHDVFIDTKSDALHSISIEEAEELIIKKGIFLEEIKKTNTNYKHPNMSPDFVKLTNMSPGFKNDLSHKISRVIQLLKERIRTIETEGEYNSLTIAKKIALLEVLGFYSLPMLENKSNSYKAKVTQQLIGGSIDLLTRNIKNFNVVEDDVDTKYGAFLHQEEMEKLVKKLK